MPKNKKQDNIDKLIAEHVDLAAQRLRAELADEKKKTKALVQALERSRDLWGATYTRPKPARRKKSSSKEFYLRVAFGDLHGTDQDVATVDALLRDLEVLKPDEIVILGDLINCAGTFSRFHRIHISEYSYSYKEDIAAGNDFLDRLMKLCPYADIYYLEGNHEARVRKWAAATFPERDLALMAIDTYGAQAALHLEKRGIPYFLNDMNHMGLHKPGIIQLGKCGFQHGYAGGAHPTQKHLLSAGMNIVHGHNHRNQHLELRTAREAAIGAWCPGCLCILQQYYNHEKATDHTHGYNLQFVRRKTDWFSSVNVSIIEGTSLLHLVEFK